MRYEELPKWVRDRVDKIPDVRAEYEAARSKLRTPRRPDNMLLRGMRNAQRDKST